MANVMRGDAQPHTKHENLRMIGYPMARLVASFSSKRLCDCGAGEPGSVGCGRGRRNRFSERIWRPAIKASSAPTGTGFHDLRHYYASLLIRHGCSVKVVQARLGHATAAETLDTYSHLWPDSDDQTREAIAENFARPVADSLRTSEGR